MLRHRWQSRDGLAIVGGMTVGVLGVMAVLLSPPLAPRGDHVSQANAGWSEIAWPLPVDPWWPSKAFTCAKAFCGTEITIYVRAKIGFCNCKTGVADDEELERIGDFAVIAERHAPTAEGRPIEVAAMRGRSRPYVYAAKGNDAATSAALLVGYNDRCDAMVATALVRHGAPTAVETAVLDFLASPRVMRWTEQTLGL